MATYSSNTTLKVSAAVAATSSPGTATSGTLYTCPSNSYAILNLCMIWVAGTHIVTVGGQRVNSSSGASYAIQIMVGPGQSVAFTNTVASGNIATISGIEFINTP